jgi:hypothetical protein
MGNDAIRKFLMEKSAKPAGGWGIFGRMGDFS